MPVRPAGGGYHAGAGASSWPRPGRPDHYMTHLSITEASGDGRPEADWGEHVTDDQYHSR